MMNIVGKIIKINGKNVIKDVPFLPTIVKVIGKMYSDIFAITTAAQMNIHDHFYRLSCI